MGADAPGTHAANRSYAWDQQRYAGDRVRESGIMPKMNLPTG